MSDETHQKWGRIKAAWANGGSVGFNTDLFDELFFHGDIANEAIALLKTSILARTQLTQMARYCSAKSLEDSDRRRVWLAVQDDRAASDLYFELRTREIPALRRQFVGNIVRGLIDLKGRAWARQQARHWWRLDDLLEEEREALVRGLVDGGISDLRFFRSLGGAAEALAEDALWRRGELGRRPVGGRLSIRRRGMSGRAGRVSAGRVESLLTPVTLDTDIRDACLEEDEVARLQSCTAMGIGNPSLFSKAVARALHKNFGPMVHELSHALAQVAPFTQSGAEAKANRWGLPLLRLLHLQQILEAPSLSKSLRTPEVALVPEVALYLIGRDAVSYIPELRIHREVDRRWRARWVESAGEALSCAFLEDAVELDLSTMSRIPERNDKPTPDFMATTVWNEKIVFEAKGGTAWASHLQQRKQAVQQLAKSGGGKTAWAGEGRAFACSLFAARQGAERSSLLHVDDPEFAFGDLFHEGWESACQQAHYAGVLETARLFDVADFVRRRERPIRRERAQSEYQVFDLAEGDRLDERHRFVGSYLPLSDWLRTLRHPDPETLRGLRIFAGVERRTFDLLSEGELPGRRSVGIEPQSREGEQVAGSITGILSSAKGEGNARGAYSVLSNGAFLAVEFE
jgi:hypothetical protein